MEKREYTNMYRQENDFWWYRTLHRLVLEVVRKEGNGNPRIFDAGCGTGRMLELLQNHGVVSGMDFSEEAIAFCKKRGLKTVELGNLNDWRGAKNGPYDVIMSLDVLYHSNIENDHFVLKNFYDGLSKNGMLVLNLAAFDILKREHDKVVHTKRRYRKSPLQKKLREIGFTVEKATYRMPHVFLIILLQKLTYRMFPAKKMVSDVHSSPKWINSIFTVLGKMENSYILRMGNIPFGSSLFIVAKKN